MPPMTPAPSHMQPELVDVDAEGARSAGRRTSRAPRRGRPCAGPTRSSQPPQIAAETPSSTKKNVYIQPRSNWLQLQLVAKSALSVPADFSPKVTAPAEHSASALPSAPSERALQRLPEHREAVGHADAEMDAQRGRRHQPAVEARLGDDALPVEQARSPLAAVGRRSAQARHTRSLGFSLLYQGLDLRLLSAYD